MGEKIKIEKWKDLPLRWIYPYLLDTFGDTRCYHSQDKTWRYKRINNCCPTILGFIHENVRNSTNDWLQPFIRLFIFHCHCLALVDYFAFRLKSRYAVLTLVMSPEANTHVEVWSLGFLLGKNSFRLQTAASVRSSFLKKHLVLIKAQDLKKTLFGWWLDNGRITGS